MSGRFYCFWKENGKAKGKTVFRKFHVKNVRIKIKGYKSEKQNK